MSTAAITRTASSGRTIRAIHRHRLLVLAGLFAALAVTVALSVAIGAKPVPPAEVWHALSTPTGTESDNVVRSLRVPRTASASSSGSRSASPGRSCRATPATRSATPACSASPPARRSPWCSPSACSASPAVRLRLVRARRRAGSAAVARLRDRLAPAGAAPPRSPWPSPGAAVGAALRARPGAACSCDERTLDGFRFWVVGSLAGRGADVAWQVAPFIAVGLLLAAGQRARRSTLLGLGEDVARSLGQRHLAAPAVGHRRDHPARRRRDRRVRADRVRRAGRAARRPAPITGPDHRWLLPVLRRCSAPSLLLLADVVGRVVARPGELQVGIVLALVGAPFFIALVRRREAGRACDPRARRLAARVGPASSAPCSAAARPCGLVPPSAAGPRSSSCVLLIGLDLRRRRLPDRASAEVLHALAGGGDGPQRVHRPASCALPRVARRRCWSARRSAWPARSPRPRPQPAGQPRHPRHHRGRQRRRGRGHRAGERRGRPAAAGLGRCRSRPCSAALLTGALLVYLLAWRRGIDGYRLVLVGIGARRPCSRVGRLAADSSARRSTTPREATVWITGSLNAPRLGARRPGRAGARRARPAALLGSRVAAGAAASATTPPAALGRTAAARAGGLMLARASGCAAAPSPPPGRSRSSRWSPRRSRCGCGGAAAAAARRRRCSARVLVVGADLVARTLLPVALPVGIVTAVARRPVPALAAGPRRRRSRMTATLTDRARSVSAPSSRLGVRRPDRRRRPRPRHPDGVGHRDRRAQRLRQVDAAARPGPAAAPVGRQVLLDGKRIAPDADPRGRHGRSALLPQSPIAPEGLTVADLVARGRHPHQTLVPAVVVATTRRWSPRRWR